MSYMICKRDEGGEGETSYVYRNFHRLLARSDAPTSLLSTTLLYIVVGDSFMFDHR